MSTTSECEYVLHTKANPNGEAAALGPSITTKCTLTGRACLCPDNHLHCLRRENANNYYAKYPTTPRPMGQEDHIVGIIDLNPPSKRG